MGRYYYLAQHGLSSPARGGGGREAAGGGRSRATALADRVRPLSHAARDSSPASGGAEAVADAIRDHYAPKGADDDVPTAPVSVAVALADKIDTLTAFWAIGKKPTGSGDPFALRRAALGVIRSILESEFRVSLTSVLNSARDQLIGVPAERVSSPFKGEARLDALANLQSAPTILAFFHERLKVYLKDKGHRYDAIDAVLVRADGAPEDDLVLIVLKLEALEGFLKTDDGANLAAGYKRAANILKAEVGRASARQNDGERRAEARPTFDQSLFQITEEKALHAALLIAEEKAQAAVAAEKFAEAMAALSSLRAPIDAFFDKVTVNDADPALRANRLALLQRFVDATATVADLSKLEG